MADEERFEIWGSCESMNIEPELIDHALDEDDAMYIVGEYTMAFRGWDVWFVDTKEKKVRCIY